MPVTKTELATAIKIEKECGVSVFDTITHKIHTVLEQENSEIADRYSDEIATVVLDELAWHPNKKLTVQFVEEILKSNEGNQVLAQKYGVLASSISLIRTGKTWRCVKGKRFKQKRGPKRPPRGEQHYLSKLTNQQVEFIKGSDQTLRELAKEYGCSFQNISYIKNGMTWKHLVRSNL